MRGGVGRFVSGVALLAATAVWGETEEMLGALVRLHLWSGTTIEGEVVNWGADSVFVTSESSRAGAARADIKRWEILRSRPPDLSAGPDSGMEAAAWRDSLVTMRRDQASWTVAGTLGAVGGGAVFVTGFVINQSSGDVEGCSSTGANTVLCTSQSAQEEAQSRIDRGLTMMLIGAVVLVGGSAGLLAGQNLGRRIREMEKRGRSRGFALSLGTARDPGLALTYRHALPN